MFARQLVAAIDLLERELRRSGLALDPALAALRAGLGVTEGHSGSSRDIGDEDPQDADVLLILSYEQAAIRLGRSVVTVKRYVRAGELKAVRLGGRSAIRVSDLEDFVAGLPPAQQNGAAA